MNILVCCKLVPEEQDISVRPDGTLDLSKGETKINPFDLNALESAVQIKAMQADTAITVLSSGGKSLENTKARKDILSRGADALAVVIDEALARALPDKTARVLAAAAGKIGFDLIICGDGSGDLYAQQTSLRLGAQLQVPVVSGVSKILSATAGTLSVERTLENDVEVLDIPLPAVISVSADINIPSIPGMKAILAAAKKPVTVFSAQDLGVDIATGTVEPISVLAPKQKTRKQVVVEGDSDEKIAEFAAHLRKILN